MANLSTSAGSCSPPRKRAKAHLGPVVDTVIAVSAVVENSPTQPSPLVIPAVTLESLPAELRRRLLFSITNLEDLRALVLASPVFHQQYLLDRKPLLGAALETTLGSVLVDAYAVQTSVSLCQPTADPESRQHAIRSFMDKYVELRSASPDRILEACKTDDHLIGIAVFYRSVAQHLVLECAARFLYNFDSALEVGNLSAMERTRLLRALYRFQLYCNLFGPGPEEDRSPHGFFLPDILAIFFCTFKPWEIEEIHCLYILVRDKYKATLEAIRAVVHKDRPNTPPGTSDIDGECKIVTVTVSFSLRKQADNSAVLLKGLRQGIAERGLRLFYAVLRTSDHEELAKRMQNYMKTPGVVEFVLEPSTQARRRLRHPLDEDRAEARGERLPFSGDTENGPALAWVTVWGGRYSNRYGGNLPERLKQRGYVFWDAERLLNSRGEGTLMRTLEAIRYLTSREIPRSTNG